MKKIIILIFVMIAIFTLGCSNDNQQVLRIAYITDTSKMQSDASIDIEESFLEISEYYTFEYDILMPNDKSDYEKIVASAFDKDYDLIIGSSSAVNSSLLSIYSTDYISDIALIDYDQTTDLALSLEFKVEESAFLAGVLAAQMSETNTIGYIGGYENEISGYLIGFTAGAKTVNTDIKIIVDYVNSYNNISASYDLALQQIDKNVDIIFANCAASTLGVNKAVNENNCFIIYSDLYTLQDTEHVLAATKKDYKKAALYILDDYINQDFRIEHLRYGIAYDMVDITMTNNVPDDIKEMINQYRSEIRDYSIQIPKNWNEYSNFNYSTYVK